jgi:alpha-beta hydrolase superfamily lysophospholipase
MADMNSRSRLANTAWRALAAVWAAAALTFALVGCTTLDEQQRRWIFQPGDRTLWAGAAGVEGLSEVWIEFDSHADGGKPVRLQGLWLEGPQADAPTMLYLHGARWDVRSSAQRMRRMQELGFAVLGIDYRGFGQSTNTLPSEDFAHEDALAAWQWLAQQRPQARHFLYGHSLGSALAVRLASQRGDVAGLILEGSFTSIPDLVSTMKWGWLPVGPWITQRFDAASRIGQVKAPVLLVHGGDDHVVEPALGRALFELAVEPKRFVLVPGASHHNTSGVGQTQIRQAVADLFGVNPATTTSTR